MIRNPCSACGDQIDASEYQRAISMGPVPKETARYKKSDFCFSCFYELAGRQIPLVTDSSLKPVGTCQVARQQYGRRHTDS